MSIFIDCEWNSYGGELISMPKLGTPSITLQELQKRLELFLRLFDSVHIIADWPKDIMWFCKVLITDPGTRLGTPPLTMEVLRVDTISLYPHNALADATALRDWYRGVDMNSVRVA